MIFAHNVFSAMQDVSVDALAVDLLREGERGRANGLMSGSKFAGTLIGGAGLGEVVGNPVHATGVGLLLWGSQLEHPHRPRINTGKAGTLFGKLSKWYRGEF